MPSPRKPAAVARDPRHVPSAADRAALAIVLALGAALRLWFAFRTSGLTMDSALYVRMAEALGRAQGPLGPAHHGYPVLIALASALLPGREWPGRIVSIVGSLAVIAITFRLARRRLPLAASAAAALLVALHPLLGVYGAALMTEATFLALAYGALLVASPAAAPTPPRAMSPRRAAAAGALLGLGYCVRPEALVIALVALPWMGGARARLAWLAAFVLCAAPEVAMLSVEHGGLTFTPKTALIAASAAAHDDAEWRATSVDSMATAPRRTWSERLGADLPAAARRYPGRMLGTLARLVESWPPPLLALSLLGALLQPGLLLAPLAMLIVLPAMGTTPTVRFTQTMLPSLAILAAIGGWRLIAWLTVARRLPRRAAVAIAALVAVAGLAWCWAGPAGRVTRRFDDGPVRSMRRAGAWLGRYARPGSRVMDRKPYVPFFAGMDQALMPDDDYDTIVRYAQRTGVDFIVVEEYVMVTIRPQFKALLTDPGFRKRENRLRMVFGGDEGPYTGVAIFAVEPPR
ncbi:MAG: glycosyltransferase family 39 protein [Candidatus Eisenbacteria bacterium]|nr:glycosyltransferase family 39 protein [Candidatus Eisenbacteria bacterium]